MKEGGEEGATRAQRVSNNPGNLAIAALQCRRNVHSLLPRLLTDCQRLSVCGPEQSRHAGDWQYQDAVWRLARFQAVVGVNSKAEEEQVGAKKMRRETVSVAVMHDMRHRTAQQHMDGMKARLD